MVVIKFVRIHLLKIGLGVGYVRHGGVKNRTTFENTLHLSSQVSSFYIWFIVAFFVGCL